MVVGLTCGAKQREDNLEAAFISGSRFAFSI